MALDRRGGGGRYTFRGECWVRTSTPVAQRRKRSVSMFKNLSFLLGVTAACSLLLVATTGPSLATTSTSLMPPCPPEECGLPIATDNSGCKDSWNCDDCAAQQGSDCPSWKQTKLNGPTDVCTICSELCAVPAMVDCFKKTGVCTTAAHFCTVGQDQCDLAHGPGETTVPIKGFVVSTTPC